MSHKQDRAKRPLGQTERKSRIILQYTLQWKTDQRNICFTKETLLLCMSCIFKYVCVTMLSVLKAICIIIKHTFIDKNYICSRF